jgi:hypothetical protein
MSSQRPEGGFALCQCEGFQSARLIVLTQHHHAEFTVIGQQDLSIGAKIFLYLLRLDCLAGLFRESLHFNHAAIRRLYGEIFRQGALFELVLSEEAAVRQSGSSILELENWLDTRFHPIANFREQSLNRWIEGRFIGGVAGCANFRQFGEIRLYGMHTLILQQ